MQTHTDRNSESEKANSANAATRNQNSSQSIISFEDNRPQAATQRKLQETINNSPRVRQLESLQQRINKPTFNAKPTVQMEPKKRDDGAFEDENYPKLVLRRNARSNDAETFYDVENTINKTIVQFSEGEYFTENGETWYPLFDVPQQGQTFYQCASYDAVVNINDIDTQGVGNEQKSKKTELRKSIIGGYIPAVTVRDAGPGRYKLVNGKNRIVVSIETGYTQIPVKIANE